MSRRRVTVQAFERTLIGMQAGIPLFRRGIDEFLLTHGFSDALEQLEAVKGKLEQLAMYEVCKKALVGAEQLVRQGPEFDEQAEGLLLEASRSLMKASGTWQAMSHRFQSANDSKG